jgi:hypothetical protein
LPRLACAFHFLSRFSALPALSPHRLPLPSSLPPLSLSAPDRSLFSSCCCC